MSFRELLVTRHSAKKDARGSVSRWLLRHFRNKTAQRMGFSGCTSDVAECRDFSYSVLQAPFRDSRFSILSKIEELFLVKNFYNLFWILLDVLVFLNHFLNDRNSSYEPLVCRILDFGNSEIQFCYQSERFQRCVAVVVLFFFGKFLVRYETRVSFKSVIA